MEVDYKWIKKKIKQTICFFLFYSGFLYLLFALYRRIKKSHPAVILFYHRFKNTHEKPITSKLDIKIFERQMLFLKRWCNVITLDKLVEHLNQKKDFASPTIVLTIDDGFKDNYDLAYPVLKRFELPATIFLTTDLINTQKAPWVDELGIALARTNLKELCFPQVFEDHSVHISNNEQKAEALHRIYEKLLYLEHDRRLKLVNILLNKLCKEDERCDQMRTMLNWEEIKEMSRNNISFGAHTMTHPTLSRMPTASAEFEIMQSKKAIEKELGTGISHFAIPNGQEKDFTEELRNFCKKGLFRSVLTTSFGSVSELTDPYALPRVCPDSRLYFFVFDLLRIFWEGGFKKK